MPCVYNIKRVQGRLAAEPEAVRTELIAQSVPIVAGASPRIRLVPGSVRYSIDNLHTTVCTQLCYAIKFDLGFMVAGIFELKQASYPLGGSFRR